jgi:predicted unusual protein kinase regulating ubiquinone biosynthesis (AarF/ABC1/UbiB family)
VTQVYKAKLKTDKNETHLVAVKILHPNIRQHLVSDLDLIEFIYKTAYHIPILKSYLHWAGAGSSIYEFREIMLSQANLVREAINLKVFEENFKNVKNIHFPKVFDDYVTEHILIESFEEGKFVSDYYDAP